VQSDFVEADLDAAFALLYDVETQYLAHDPAGALRAIQEAGKALVDGQERLLALNDHDRERLQSQLERMRNVVQRIGSQMNLS